MYFSDMKMRKKEFYAQKGQKFTIFSIIFLREVKFDERNSAKYYKIMKVKHFSLFPLFKSTLA